MATLGLSSLILLETQKLKKKKGSLLAPDNLLHQTYAHQSHNSFDNAPSVSKLFSSLLSTCCRTLKNYFNYFKPTSKDRWSTLPSFFIGYTTLLPLLPFLRKLDPPSFSRFFFFAKSRPNSRRRSRGGRKCSVADKEGRKR